jgi:tetratricopeptide (TPR) repeat protein
LLSTILDALGVALLNRGCLPEGKRLIELALEIRRTFLGKRHPAVAASLNNVARVQRMEDKLLRAGKTIAEALAINKAAYGANGLPLVATYVEQSVLQLYQGDARAAERTAKRGLAILKRLGLERDDANSTRLLDALGRSLETRGRLASDRKAARIFFAAAVKTMTAAVSMDEKQVGTDHPKYATHRANLACAQWALNKLDLAAEGFREAIRVYEQVLQRPGHPNLIDAYANWGSVLSQMGRYADAKDALCRALTHNQQSRGPMHTLVGNDHANLGRLYFRQKDYQRATDEFNVALKIYLANVKAGRLPARHPYIAEVREWLCKPQT